MSPTIEYEEVSLSSSPSVNSVLGAWDADYCTLLMFRFLASVSIKCTVDATEGFSACL